MVTSNMLNTAPVPAQSKRSPASEKAPVDVTYPMSSEYVADWTPDRALTELIANAFDADRRPTVVYRDGRAIIADRGVGLTEASLVLGVSDKGADDIGRFGEGAKLAMLTLARTYGPDAMETLTVGATLRPALRPTSLGLGGEPTDMLVVSVTPNRRRRRGTEHRVTCPPEVFEAARNRFLQLTSSRYRPPEGTGRVLPGPGRIHIAGVLIADNDELVVGYDFAARAAKQAMNRDRVVIDLWQLRSLVARTLSECTDPTVLERVVAAAVEGRLGSLERPQAPTEPARRAWRTAGRRVLGTRRCCWVEDRTDPVGVDLAERGWRVVVSCGDRDSFSATMAAAGVPPAADADRSRQSTSWVGRARLDATEQDVLRSVLRLARRRFGPDAVPTVRVFDRHEPDSWSGFYDPQRDVIAVRRDLLADPDELRVVFVHELAHRIAYRRGGEWEDRTRGFEAVLSELAARCLLPRGSSR